MTHLTYTKAPNDGSFGEQVNSGSEDETARQTDPVGSHDQIRSNRLGLRPTGV